MVSRSFGGSKMPNVGNRITLYFKDPNSLDVDSIRMLASMGYEFKKMTCGTTHLSALHVACKHGHYDIARVLIEECDCDVNLRVCVINELENAIVTPCDMFIDSLRHHLNFNQTFPTSIINLANLLFNHTALVAYPGKKKFPLFLLYATNDWCSIIRLGVRAGCKFSTISHIPLSCPAVLDVLIRGNAKEFRGRLLKTDQDDFMQRAVLSMASDSVMRLLWFYGVPRYLLPSKEFFKNCSVPPLAAMCITVIYSTNQGKHFLPRGFFFWPDEELSRHCEDSYLRIPWNLR